MRFLVCRISQVTSVIEHGNARQCQLLRFVPEAVNFYPIWQRIHDPFIGNISVDLFFPRNG